MFDSGCCRRSRPRLLHLQLNRPLQWATKHLRSPSFPEVLAPNMADLKLALLRRCLSRRAISAKPSTAGASPAFLHWELPPAQAAANPDCLLVAEPSSPLLRRRELKPLRRAYTSALAVSPWRKPSAATAMSLLSTCSPICVGRVTTELGPPRTLMGAK